MLKRKLKNKPFLIQLAYAIHPQLGEFYERAERFINDGITELIALIISNIFLYFLTAMGFVELWLVILNLLIVTPITFTLKFLLHKYWVWRGTAK